MITEREERLLEVLKELCAAGISASRYVDHDDIISGSLQHAIREAEELIWEYENDAEDV